MTDRHGLPPEDVSSVTVEVDRPKIKTVVKCMEDGDFYSHERPVCVPETCDVRITVVTILQEIGGVCCLRNSGASMAGSHIFSSCRTAHLLHLTTETGPSPAFRDKDFCLVVLAEQSPAHML